MPASPARVFGHLCPATPLLAPMPVPAYINTSRAPNGAARISSMATSTAPAESCAVSLSEWQAWGTASPVPSAVADVIRDLKALERDGDSPMSFSGLGGKLQGNFKVQEDKKHRAVYESLNDSEKKLQFFSARQIACRLLGSRGYLCQKCWLAMEDCMCQKIVPCSLWCGMRFWLYMHPKDFLRQNNTGKLLWQIFGIQAASLCLFGIHELEEIMWDAFKYSGKNMVWFLYPNKNASVKSVQDIFFDKSFTNTEGQTRIFIRNFMEFIVFVSSIREYNARRRSCLNNRLPSGKPGKLVSLINSPKKENEDLAEKPLNFVLIDGTWSNSAAMHNRLKERWVSLWGHEELPCISLSSMGTSVMHKLRPQPAWDRTCTAAAAAGLLSELHHRPELSLHGLDRQAEAVENALDILLDALTTRRLRMGRSITRKERKSALFRQ